ncbi:MAG: caspase family protein [Saccharospirillaceae bacterium]|nr:caspase family protein [Colwellia sp.]NRB77600.1 caspase family protein [Saccharospirillaceae bacterium]
MIKITGKYGKIERISVLLFALFIIIVFLLSVYGFENKEQENTKPNENLAKFAFIIGNQDYVGRDADLNNPINDVNAMEEKLHALDFTTIKLKNSFKHHFDLRFKEFIKLVRNSKREGKQIVTLFFYAGHGIQFDNINYIVPVETELFQQSNPITSQDIRRELISLKKVTNKLATLDSMINIVILDACRNLPIEGLEAHSGGWADVVQADFFVAFGTGPGAEAADGNGSNGLFTSSIIQYIDTKGQSLSQLFQRVRKDVIEASHGEQIPQDSNRATVDFYFIPGKKTSYLWQLFLIAFLLVSSSVWFVFYHKKQKVAWVTGIDLTSHIMRDKVHVEEMVSRSRLQKNITGYVKDLKRKKVICLIYDKKLTIGRDPSCNIHLPDDEKYVSRFHCDLAWDNEKQRFWLEESLNKPAANGTYSGALAEKGEGGEFGEGKIIPGQRYYLEPGEVFYLADPKEKGWPMTIIKHKSN